MCTNPYLVPSLGFTVPCGQCMSCRIARSREWTERILGEAECWENAVFVTLTYDPNNIKTTTGRYSLKKEDLTNFFKNLRYRLDNRKIKYYAIGEYGEKFEGGHFHAIIYGLRFCGGCESCNVSDRRRQSPARPGTDCDRLKQAWPYGFVDVSGVGPESAGYVAKYVTKFDSRNYDGREPPFSRCSRGLGLSWLIANKEKVWKTKALRKKGNLVPLPRYYVKKMDRFFRLKPELNGKRIELLLFDGSKGSLATWIVGRHRWRMMQSQEVKKISRLLERKGVEWSSLAGAMYDDRRQSDRNVRDALSMKERS